MKVNDVLKENIQKAPSSEQVVYHGTNSDFTSFKLDAEKQNRGMNVTGVYFTPRKSSAETYGDRIIKANVKVESPFFNLGGNDINEGMQKATKEYMLKYTNHPEHWIDEVIVPDFVEKQTFTRSVSDLGGDAKRDILIAGGYDAYIDGEDIVVLHPEKQITVLDWDLENNED